MKVNFDLGSRGVARSFKKLICIFAPGNCMPACHAKLGCFSRKRIEGAGEVLGAVSWRAIAIAREAGPKPMQRRSRVSLGEEDRGDVVWPLRCMLVRCPFKEEPPFEWKLDTSSVGVLIADGAIFACVRS